MFTSSEVFFDTIIVPDRAIFRRKVYQMDIEPELFLKGYKIIKTEKGLIDKIFIRGKHPNADPRTREFCIPFAFRHMSILDGKKVENLIENKLSCYNLDDCYFIPWDKIDLIEPEVF